MDVNILNTNHGTASGWDGEELWRCFYDFVPADDSIFVACSCLNIDLSDGFAVALDDNNKIVEQYTLHSEWKAAK